MSALLLLPNLGAEDERPLAVVDAPLAARLARTWGLLFASGAKLEGGGVLERPAWMEGDESAAFPFLNGVEGLVPWLSTTDAEERASGLGLRYESAPSAVTKQVSDKGWALSVARELSLLPPALDEVLRAFTADELAAPDARALVDEHLAGWPAPFRENFTLKPRFGSSGRGRVKGRGGRLDDAGANALPRLARRGGAVLEPWLVREEDLSAQLFLDEGGRVHLLGTTRQLTTPSGGWLGNRTVLKEDGALRSGSFQDEALEQAALLFAERAAREGFRGPLGIDAFSYRAPDGALAFRPIVEANARFTMGMVTLGLARRAERAGRLEPGQRCTFHARPDDEKRPSGERLSLPQGALELSSA